VPLVPNTKLLLPEFIKRYDNLTLFYIFYYLPASPPQYFAGRELRSRDWKFHKKEQTWYRRLAEPTEVTKDYEIGKFERFDHGDNWGITTIPSFTLEYALVES
jgi:CCR4-NOT transcription complex subunit 3